MMERMFRLVYGYRGVQAPLFTDKMKQTDIPEMEVLNIDVLVRSSLSLAPEQQTFLGGHLFHRDVLDGETQDNGPDHTQGHFHVSVDNF